MKISKLYDYKGDSKFLKRMLLRRDGNTCRICKRRFEAGQLTIEHIMPRSKGGGDNPTNLCLSCYPCNQLKADKTPDEFWKDKRRAPYSLARRAAARRRALDWWNNHDKNYRNPEREAIRKQLRGAV